jgi:hypothetical protein
MRLFADLDMLSIVKLGRLNWISYFRRMDSNRTVSHMLHNNSQGRRLKGRPKTDGGTVYKQILINAKLQIGKAGQRTELTGRSQLRSRRPLMYFLLCSL